MAEIARLTGRAVRAEPGTDTGDKGLAGAVTGLIGTRPAYPRPGR